MSDTPARIVSVLAAALGAAALAVSLTHSGPAGTQGPRGQQGAPGQAGKAAETAHLGLCVNMAVQTGVVYMPVNSYNGSPVSSPVLTDGVPSCPSGQFVSIVPQTP